MIAHTSEWWPKDRSQLELLVVDGVEESWTIEFKREPHPPAKQNEELAKDIAAMANSSGGMILFGVDERDGRAIALTPFSIGRFPERVSQIARTGIDEPLSVGVRVIPFEAGEGAVVVDVPRSHRAPHFVRGTVWGRTSKGNTTLTRRQVGELYARSEGFAAEFGLTIGRPGRVACRSVAEFRPSSGTASPLQHYLVFSNDGDVDVTDVSWEFDEIDDAVQLIVSSNPFPVNRMRNGEEIRVRYHIAQSGRMGMPRIRVGWIDLNGARHEEDWSVSW